MDKKSFKLLVKIAEATQDAVRGFLFVTEAEAIAAGVNENPQLVLVNAQMIDPTDPSKRAAKATEAGIQYVANHVNAAPAGGSQSPFSILSGVVLPEAKKRGGGAGAPTVYPFEAMEVGSTFFVPKSADRPDPVKSLGSTISAANLRYAVKTGEVEKSVTKRGPKNKAVIDPATGKPEKVNKLMPVYKHTRKFTVRAVEGGKTYGTWTAPSDGAIVARVPISE